MDAKTAKRIDSLYRNVKQLPLLGCLSIIIPIFGLFLLPLVLVYKYLLNQLRKEHAKGQIEYNAAERSSKKPGEPSIDEKLRLLLHEDTRLGLPFAIGVFWYLVLGGVAILVVMASWHE